MNSLIQKRPSKQFRCRVEAGHLRYEEILRVEGEADNYQPAAPMVVQNAWNEFYRKPEAIQCETLTAGSKTSAVFQCASFAGSLNPVALFTFAKIMTMESASALLTSSSATSGK